MIPFTKTSTGITFNLKGRPRTISNDNPNYEAILKAVFANDVKEVSSLCDIPSFLARITKGEVQISDDEVRFKGEKVPEFLASRILEYVRENIPLDSICAFATKLMENPTLDVREDLYKWIEKGNMPIYEDGDILGYKVVQADFYSIHSGVNGKLFQGVGEIVVQDRDKCNPHRNATCAEGLHFCSYDYLPHFSGFSTSNRIIIVKINPRDVVAIPTDYNLTKGRCCRFEVMETVPVDEIESRFFGKLVVNSGKQTEASYSHWGQETTSDEDSWEFETSTEGSWNEYGEENEDKLVQFPSSYIDVSLKTSSATPVSSTSSRSFTRNGKTFTYDELKKAVNELGSTAASKKLGVPRSTIYGWLNS